MSKFVMFAVLAICTFTGHSEMNVRERYAQWQDIWPEGRNALAKMGFALAGRFMPSVDEASWSTRVKLLMAGKDNSFEVAGWGNERWDAISLCNDREPGFWWMVRFSDLGTMQTRLRAGGGVGLGYNLAKAAARNQFYAENPQLNLRNRGLVGWCKDCWEMIFNTSPEGFDDWMKNQNKNWDANMGKMFGKRISDSRTGAIYHVDLSKKGTVEREEIARFACGDPKAIDDAESLVVSFADEFRSRLNLVRSRPNKRNRVCELPHGAANEMRQAAARQALQAVVEVKKKLKACGRPTTPREIYKAIGEANAAIWTDKSKLADVSKKFYECCERMLPHAGELIWGNRDKVEVRCGQRAVDEAWRFDAVCMAGMQHSTLNRYALQGDVVVRRVKDVKRKISGDRESRDCYCLEIIPGATIDGLDIKTSLRLSPTQTDGRLPTFSWSQAQDSDKFIYIDKKTGSLVSFDLNFRASVGHVSNMEVGISGYEGLLLKENSEVLLRMNYELEETSDDWRETVRKKTPFAKGLEM